MEVTWGEYTVSTDPARLDLGMVHGYLTVSYWAGGIPAGTVRRSVENSLCFGLYHGPSQVGFARVVTDRATFAYLCDVFILEGHRGRRLGRWLIETVRGHPDLQGLRRWVLVTADAHGLYRPFGFTPLRTPDRYMEVFDPNVYRAGGAGAG
jgi:GNAT superfamily N-acetyltransferase